MQMGVQRGLETSAMTHMEGSNKEGQSQEVEVCIHEDSFNLVSILLCET